MKPYRGTLVAAAVLLATLSLTGCGDADNWEKTSDVTLVSNISTVVVKNEVTFTAEAPPPPLTDGYQCETALEYWAVGGGYLGGWVPIPGDGPTRIWQLKPWKVGELSVKARGKCVGSKEDWKYSDQVDVTVTEPELPTVTAVTLTATPTTVTEGNQVIFTLGATKTSTCTLKMKYQYSGGGLPTTTENGVTPGQFPLTPPAAGTLVVTATGWCSQNPSAEVAVTVNVVVTTP